ncbi:leucine-rich repeat-containing protein [Asbolus verrucosus]|uniref:Leucine-rich repeat-containing protein n=1 Tax=Asbolus verrucosus TaxID=1661398 RepID=A0A482WEB8_ASBVE|nr:leucine-rich repeat-containing protein [Asbolus verrucosus]
MAVCELYRRIKKQNGSNTFKYVESQQFLVNVLSANLIDLEDRNEALGMELSLLTKSYKKLQDCTFELEVEHFNSLQDIAILETQLHKYQNEFRSLEDSKYGTRSEVKKLRQQKRCYEHALECFRNEMSVMSEQLIHLQEILKLSNQSCKEENGQLYKAIVDLQQICDRLQVQLIEAEKKVLVENQMNQLKDQKIDELQLIIGQKNADLNVHDEAIHDMKLKLENAVIENHELQNTIVSLNSTIMQLQCALASRDGVCKSKSTVGRKSMSSFKDDLEKRDRKYEKLQMDYKAQYEMLKALQKEFDKVKEKDKMKTKALKRQLIELNESLAESELHQTALAEVFQKKVHEDRQQEDLYLSCRCEIALYKKLMEDFKQSFEEAKKNLTDMKIQNKSLTEQLKHKENKLNEMQKKLAKKEKEISQNFKEMAEKLKRSQEEEKRLSEFIENLKGEIQKRIAHNNEKDVRRPGFCPCNKMENFPYDDIDGMATTHEEIASLKIEIKRMIQNQLALNNENDKLLKQVTCLQTTVTTLEGKNCNLKQKVEKAQLENQKLRENNKQLSREKETFAQMVRNLEIELAETRNCRDDVCEESRHVVNNVKAWLEEQKKINNKVKKRAQCYCDTITKLKQENASLLNRSAAAPPTVKSNRPIKNYTSLVPPPPTIECQSPWCLDSQGLDSPRDSPSSFLTCSIEEWYSPNYRDETDFETDHEEEFVNRLEAVTLEMRNNNKKWKDKYKQDCECIP